MQIVTHVDIRKKKGVKSGWEIVLTSALTGVGTPYRGMLTWGYDFVLK